MRLMPTQPPAAAQDAAPQIIGCDFSSSPSRKKPIVLASCGTNSLGFLLLKIEHFETLDDWAAWLAAPGNWVGGFDLPFGLPRELVEQLGWPLAWRDCIAHYARLSRADIRATFAAFCAARPAGRKFAHRATDRPAGASPSMKWVNPPVAWMLHAGVPRLLAAGVHLPGLHDGDARRVALEAYPGLLAREVLGRRSYKSDTPAKQTSERADARRQLLAALAQGQTRLGLRLQLTPAQQQQLAADATGDSLDAVLCALQAAWALQQKQHGHPRYGLPPFDPLEGWIATA